ncbi:hypothetical protein JCM5353_000947 [Sporobolomyces roseus]
MPNSRPTPAEVERSRVTDSQGPSASKEAAPLDFDSEAELLALLDRMRQDLRQRVTIAIENAAVQGKGKGKEASGMDRAKVNEIVEKEFFDLAVQTVLKNCTIAGQPYVIDSKTKKVILKGDAAQTQPLDQKLDQSVRNYQEKLFAARQISVQERMNAPGRTAEEIKRILALDREELDRVGATFELPPTDQELRPAKKTEETDGVTSAQAQDYYATGREELKQLLRDVPELSNATDQATKTALDTSKIR